MRYLGWEEGGGDGDKEYEPVSRIPVHVHGEEDLIATTERSISICSTHSQKILVISINFQAGENGNAAINVPKTIPTTMPKMRRFILVRRIYSRKRIKIIGNSVIVTSRKSNGATYTRVTASASIFSPESDVIVPARTITVKAYAIRNHTK